MQNLSTKSLNEIEIPKDRAAEEAVVGSVFIDPDRLDEVLATAKLGDFFYDHTRSILEACEQVRDKGRPIDPLVIAKHLGGRLDDLGGVAMLREVVESVPAAFNAVHYAKMVRESSVRRQAICAGRDLVTGGVASDDINQVISTAESRLYAIRDMATAHKPFLLADKLSDAMARMVAVMSGTLVPGLPTGFTDLDEKLSGLHRGDLIICAARPSMGKTALALNIAVNACRQGKRVLVSSLEMASLELADRILASESGVSLKKMRSGTISHEECSRLVESASSLSSMKLLIDDHTPRTVGEIGGVARQVKRQADEGGLDLLVVDYIQLVESNYRHESRQEQVAATGRYFKQIARNLDIPVIVVAQLNRQPEATADKRPRLSHLRESGALEQDADVVLLMHREDYYANTEQERLSLKGKALCIVAKHRNGPVGDVPLVWDAETVTFKNAAHEWKFGQEM